MNEEQFFSNLQEIDEKWRFAERGELRTFCDCCGPERDCCPITAVAEYRLNRLWRLDEVCEAADALGLDEHTRNRLMDAAENTLRGGPCEGDWALQVMRTRRRLLAVARPVFRARSA